MLKEFRAFLLRGNLLELAIAFVIGAAFVTVVNDDVHRAAAELVTLMESTP